MPVEQQSWLEPEVSPRDWAMAEPAPTRSLDAVRASSPGEGCCWSKKPQKAGTSCHQRLFPA